MGAMLMLCPMAASASATPTREDEGEDPGANWSAGEVMDDLI